jgi:hypothetical protein
MAGFTPVDVIEVYGVPCLRLVPDPDADALPDLHDVLAAVVPAGGANGDALRAAVDRAERAEQRIRELADQLAAATLPQPADERAQPAGSADRRMPQPAAGLLAAGSAAALVLTSRDRRAALLTTGLGALSVAQLWYLRRMKAQLQRPAPRPTAPAPVAPAPAEDLLTKVLAQQTEIHRNLAIVTAAMQDVAAAVSALRTER